MVLKLLKIHRLKQHFCQLFIMGVLVFCCSYSNIDFVFFKQLCHLTFKLRPIITLKYLWVLKHATFVIDCFQHKCNLA